jgi:hypothetical protein
MRRPLSILIIGWLFIVTGLTGFVYHLGELNFDDLFSNDAILTLMVRLLGVAGGILVLRAVNLGRWLLMAWLVFHVGLSFYHSVFEIVFHAVITVGIGFFLFRRDAGEFFKKRA